MISNTNRKRALKRALTFALKRAEVIWIWMFSSLIYCTVLYWYTHMNVERWRKGTLSVTLESTAKPVKVAAVSKPSEPESVLQKQLTDARANVKKLTLQVQELTEANATLSKKLADAAGREKVVQITTLATATSTPIAVRCGTQ